ncbi:hypothetical protein Hanom_Chr05g00398051 [Helianthus anomalus]
MKITEPSSESLTTSSKSELDSTRCITDGKYQQAIGMSIECRRLDKLREAITKSANVHATLSYCTDVSHAFVNRRQYRLPYAPRSTRWCCKHTRETFKIRKKDDAMMAFQIAFDLIENEHQAFLLSARDQLSSPKLKPETPPVTERNPSVSEPQRTLKWLMKRNHLLLQRLQCLNRFS